MMTPAAKAERIEYLKGMVPTAASYGELVEALRDVSRVLTPTDPSKFSAEDARRRIGVAQVLIAQALVKVPS